MPRFIVTLKRYVPEAHFAPHINKTFEAPTILVALAQADAYVRAHPEYTIVGIKPYERPDKPLPDNEAPR